MKRVLQIFMLGLLLLWPLGKDLNAADLRSAIRDGLKDLDVRKGETGLCVLTDASYVIIDGKTTEPLVDLIREETGCTVGKGNLLFFHRPINHPLKIAIFRKSTEECVVVRYDGKRIDRHKYDFGAEEVAKSSFWQKTDALLAQDKYTIVSIARVWAADAPYDLLKCVDFHGHLCPGIFAGYMVARYIPKTYPLKKGEAYTWIASPLWCKDDAIQVLLDLTAGKKDIYPIALTTPQKEELTFENPAGFLIVWNKEKKTGKGVVFSFAWDKVRKKGKLQTVLNLLGYVEKPEELVSVVKECEVTPGIMEKLKTEETNPYRWLGLTSAHP